MWGIRKFLVCGVLLGCSRSQLETLTPEAEKPGSAPVCPASDGPEIVLTRDMPFIPVGLAVVGDWVYFGGTSTTGNYVTAQELPLGGLFRVPTTGGAYERIATDYARGTIVSDGRFLYYPKVAWQLMSWRGEDIFLAGSTTLVARPLDGGPAIDIPNPRPTVSLGPARVNDRPGVYWASTAGREGWTLNHWDTHASVAVMRWDTAGSFAVSRDTLFYLDHHAQLVTGNLDGTNLRTSGRQYASILHVSNDGTVLADRNQQLVRLSGDLEMETAIHVEADFDPMLSLAMTSNGDDLYYSWHNFTIARASISSCVDPRSIECATKGMLYGQATELKGVVVSDCSVFWITKNPPAVLTRTRR